MNNFKHACLCFTANYMNHFPSVIKLLLQNQSPKCSYSGFTLKVINFPFSDLQLGLVAHTHLGSPACQGGSPYLVHHTRFEFQSVSIWSSKLDIDTFFSDAKDF